MPDISDSLSQYGSAGKLQTGFGQSLEERPGAIHPTWVSALENNDSVTELNLGLLAHGIAKPTY